MTIRFVAHAEVEIDPMIPVPEWSLSETGRARHRAHAEHLSHSGYAPAEIWTSPERKAREAAEILAAVLRVELKIDPDLAENDRSSTGYLPKDEFEAMADRFFAEPEVSVRGWERAADAQRRIWAALRRIDADNRHRLVIAHGGVGALSMSRALGKPISRAFDQPGRGGGCEFLLETDPASLVQGWRIIGN